MCEERNTSIFKKDSCLIEKDSLQQSTARQRANDLPRKKRSARNQREERKNLCDYDFITISIVSSSPGAIKILASRKVSAVISAIGFWESKGQDLAIFYITIVNLFRK